jgi:lipoprotein-releasing system permease protein
VLTGRWQRFEWIVAVRFLREGRAQSLSIMGGVAIGVAVIVFMSALLHALQNNLVRRVLTAQPHIQVLPPHDSVRVQHGDDGQWHLDRIQPPLQRMRSIDQWQSVVSLLQSTPGVKHVAAVLTGSTLVARGGVTRSLNLTAIEPDSYQKIVNLQDKLLIGAVRLGGSDILIGMELASDLGLGIGDKLVLLPVTGKGSHYTVSGILDFGSKQGNQRNAYVALHSGQSLLGIPGGVTAIDVTTWDVYAAEHIAQWISALTGLQADSWIHNNAQMFSAVRAQTLANRAIRFFVAMSVAFGIASVLVVSVVQRSREIGILRAMGVSRGQVMRVFLIQGGLLGLGGAVLGCVLGALALRAWLAYARTPEGAPMFEVQWEPGLFIAALALATITGLLAAFAPALRAARLEPVVAIRG